MKKNSYKPVNCRLRPVPGAIVCLLLLSISSCTGRFKDLNTDKTGVTPEDMQADMNHLRVPLSVIQQGIYFNYDFGKGKNWPFQLIQNLNADMFSGYMHDYKPFNGGSHNSDYNLQAGWNGACWEHVYAYVFPQIKRLEDSTRHVYPLFFGMAKLLKVEIMHRVSDIYGPIIYSHFADRGMEYLPDTQEEAYYHFFRDLDTAMINLQDTYLQQTYLGHLADFDVLMDGKIESWMKFVNVLRMRLAIRLAMVAPEKARTEYLKGFSHDAGIFEEAEERVAVSTRDGFVNPLGVINDVWGEAYMNASMESILLGYEDPRLPVYFKPCPEDVMLQLATGQDTAVIPLKGTYKGIRQGTLFAHNHYASHSRIYTTEKDEAILLTAAEVWFLRAEAALRGWTSEDPCTCYENGVRTSFNQWGVSGADEYLQREAIGADYIDAFSADNNIRARCRVSPAWISCASNEEKLEKIITQKWLAMFPEGCEAWAEQRRTGYPRLFPVKVNNSENGCIDTEVMIRRLNLPEYVQGTDPAQFAALQKALGGPDHAGTRLWWDTGRNFNYVSE